MKKIILVLAVVFSIVFSHTLLAQLVLDATIPKPFLSTEIHAVDLSLSGKKIVTMAYGGMISTDDTLFFYNRDYSFWKKIILPRLTGYQNAYHFYTNAVSSHCILSF